MIKQPFSRELSEGHIEAVKKSDLYQKHLLPDIERGDVFPAIRKNTLSFYYRGWSLFKHSRVQGDWRYSTNCRFGLIPRAGDDRTYITEEDIRKAKLVGSFSEAYAGIKKNVEQLEEPERKGVGDICRVASHARTDVGDVVVLDVEVALPRCVFREPTQHERPKRRETDRIDFVLLSRKKGELKFFEAKRFGNPELSDNPTPSVVGQLTRYECQLKENGDYIRAEYVKYVRLMNELFCRDLPVPTGVNPAVQLLVFEYGSSPESEVQEYLDKIRPHSACRKDVTNFSQGTLRKWIRGR